MSRCIDADALIADCHLAQKQADRHGREFANAFYSGGGEVSTEWWCVEDMIENAPTIEPEHKKGKWINHRCDDGHHIADCDQCGHSLQWFDDDIPKYCCECGADMREPEDIPMEYFESGGR